jgi:hypothetical protein
MTKITTFDEDTVNALQTEMNDFFKKLSDEHGVDFNINFTGMNPTDVKFKGSARISGVVPLNKESSTNVLNTVIAKLELSKTGKNGEKLTGYDSRRWKMPFTYKTADGSDWKCNEERAIDIFGKDVEPEHGAGKAVKETEKS